MNKKVLTFDEYTKQVFMNRNTPEILAIAKKLYDGYVLSIDDEDFFEPYEYKSGSDDSSIYEQNLRDIFNLSAIRENQIYLLIKPAFEPESLLIITRNLTHYTATYKKLIENYWYVFYADNSITSVAHELLERTLGNKIGENIFSLLNKTIIEARPPKGNRFVIDGVKYIISKLVDDKLISVCKSSPSEDSDSGQVISIITQFIETIQTSDDSSLYNP